MDSWATVELLLESSTDYPIDFSLEPPLSQTPSSNMDLSNGTQQPEASIAEIASGLLDLKNARVEEVTTYPNKHGNEQSRLPTLSTERSSPCFPVLLDQPTLSSRLGHLFQEMEALSDAPEPWFSKVRSP